MISLITAFAMSIFFFMYVLLAFTISYSIVAFHRFIKQNLVGFLFLVALFLPGGWRREREKLKSINLVNVDKYLNKCFERKWKRSLKIPREKCVLSEN
jgi:hypothetical protein